ncbi:MAG: hypothetical protein LBE84_02330 [Planctomycetota bacterium]|jgi:hypothetical protein|nr:hypothetical protein [Planctomycetota bacterium]
MNTRDSFRRIDPRLYRHPGETKARKSLERLPAFARGMAMLSDSAGGGAERRSDFASLIRVGPGVHPRLHDLWRDSLDRFGLDDSSLHLAFRPAQPWAFHNSDGPVLVLDASWLEILPHGEMAALLAMRAGDIRLGNAPWLAAIDLLRRLEDFSGLAAVPILALAWGLENWRRFAMFSSDRAAALSLGGTEQVAALLGRLAGIGGGSAWGGVADDAIRLQGVEALSLERDWANGAIRRFAMAMNRGNHGAIVRRLDLLSWFAGGIPDRLLAGEIVEPAAEESAAAGESADETGPAFWGAFAGQAAATDGGIPAKGADLAEAVEKGWAAFRQAGEALWHSLDPFGWPPDRPKDKR